MQYLGLAQLVEHRPVKSDVAGSSPASPAILGITNCNSPQNDPQAGVETLDEMVLL